MGAQSSADRTSPRHAEASADLPASAREIFAFLDEHRNLASHMETSRSPMMAGGTMQLLLDERHGRTIGSHIVMRGRVLGLDLFVDQIVTDTEVVLNADHMPGLDGAEATIDSATDETVYMVDLEMDGMTMTNHKWVVESEIQPAP